MPRTNRKTNKVAAKHQKKSNPIKDVGSVSSAAHQEARNLLQSGVIDRIAFMQYSLFLNEVHKKYLDMARDGNISAGKRFFSAVNGHKKAVLGIATANSKIRLDAKTEKQVKEAQATAANTSTQQTKRKEKKSRTKTSPKKPSKIRNAKKPIPLKKRFATPTTKGSLLAEQTALELSKEIEKIKRRAIASSRYLPQTNSKIKELETKRKQLIDYMSGSLPADHKVALYLNGLK